MIVVRQALVFLVAGSLGYAGAASGQALSAGDPPGRVGRLAFLQGTVSFHDSNRTDWAPAMVNTPITTGDAIWTEPNAHSEISIAGTRVRLDSATQLDMLALDDTQTRMQIDQGRVDIKTFTYDTRQPYEIVTPRGVVSLQQQGDYYVEAGSTQDPTRLGVRQGAAQFQTPNGQVLAVQAGQVAEVTGDGNAIQLHTIQAPPPPMPTYWAQRDRVVVYEQPPQYLSASVTGYEDLNYYGSWTNDPEYGQVWYARSVPQGWAPYTSGRWISDPMYGWTWVDEQPWGFAPYHYGRWAQRNNRWFWVPPERTQRAVYAPALVAFVGGTELGMALGMQNRQPVGWFPLGPREAYVPSYTSNRDYYRRLNLTARVQERALEDRWERAQRRETIQQAMLNRRFTTVVPADDFARSRPVNRTAIQFAPERLASVPVAAVAAPPQPNQSIRALQAPVNDRDARDRTDRPNDRDGRPGMAGVAAGAAGVAGAAALMAIKPEPERQRAPGPQIATRPAATAPTADQKPALPQLAPRNASAPPPPQIQGDRRPATTTQPGATTQPGSQQAIAPADRPATPAQPGAATPPPSPPQATAPTSRPGDSDRARPGEPPRPGQANLPPVRDRNDQRPEPPRPGEPPKPPQAQTAPGAQQATPQPPRPGEPPKSPQAQTMPGAAPQPPRPGEPPRSPQAQTAPGAQQAAPQPARPGEPPKPPQAQNAPAGQQPQRQAEPPKPPQAQTPPRPPQQATPPAPPPQQQIQRQPMPQHQPAPPPQQVQAPRPQPAPPPQAQATHPQPAPPPQQVQAPRPQPAPPPQAQAPHPQPAPPPQQVQAPRPQPAPPPPQAQAPRPQPAPPPQQAQSPRPQPAPPPQQAQPKPPQPQQPGQQKQQDDKK